MEKQILGHAMELVYCYFFREGWLKRICNFSDLSQVCWNGPNIFRAASFYRALEPQILLLSFPKLKHNIKKKTRAPNVFRAQLDSEKSLRAQLALHQVLVFDVV